MPVEIAAKIRIVGPDRITVEECVSCDDCAKSVHLDVYGEICEHPRCAVTPFYVGVRVVSEQCHLCGALMVVPS